MRVFGVDPATDRDQIAPRIGIMLQDAGFFETLTVAQTVRAWRRFHLNPQPAQTVIDAVGLGGRTGVRCAHLSGGERRRLDLALALLGNPSLLFLDEPTTGMDPEARRDCLTVVRKLVDRGVTVVLTTHYLEEAEQLADRVAIMHRGKIVRQGTVDELRRLGGRSQVRFGLDAQWVDALPDLPGCSITAERRAAVSTVCVGADDSQAVLGALTAWAAPRGINLHDLRIQTASLEDVFLQIAGDTSRNNTSQTPTGQTLSTVGAHAKEGKS